MEPVEIDIRMKQNVSEEGKKATKAVGDLDDAAAKAGDVLKEKISGQRQLIKELEADIAKIQKAYERATPGRAKMEMGQELGAAKRALEEESDALTLLEGQVEKTAEKHTMLRTEVMNAKDELARLEMAGKRGSAEWDTAAAKLGHLNDQMKDTNQVAGILADDEKKFKAVASGVAGLAGAMSAAVGVASLFGAEQEELARIQTRLQSVMAITIGLQQVAEALNKDSYFSVVMLTKAKAGWAAAQTFLNTQLGIGVGLSKALMVSGIGLLIAGIGALVVLYQNWSKRQEEINALKKEYTEIESGTAKAMANEKVAAEQLLKVAGDHNKSLDIRKQAVERLNKLMPDYNGYLNKEGQLVGNADTALKNYLVSLYKVEKAKKLLAKIEDKQGEIDTSVAAEPEKAGFWQKAGAFLAQNSYATYDAIVDNTNEKYRQKKEDGITKLKAEKKAFEDELDKLVGDPNVFKSVFGSPDKPTGGGGPSNSPANATSRAEYDAQKALADQLAMLHKQTQALEIDQMQDAHEKKLRQIDAEGQAELDKVKENKQKIVDEYNKTYGTEITDVALIPGIDPKTLNSIGEEEQKIVVATLAKKIKATADAQKEITDLAMSYGDERVQIAAQYEEDIAKLEKNGQTAAANAAKAERDQRISDVTVEMITSTELYKTATDEKLLISAEATARLIEDIKKRIAAELAAGNLSKEKAKEMLDELDKTGVSREKSKNQNNPFAQLITGVGDYKKALEGVKAAKAGGASAEEVAKLEAAANNALKSTAGAAGAALQGTQQILGSVVDGLDSLGMLTDEQKKDAQDVMGMVGGAADIAMGIASGNPVGIITGSIKLLTSAIALFDKKSKDIEKAQKKHLQNVSDLERTYTRLQRAVDKSLGTDVYGAQKALIENNKKQIAEYEAWIAQERKKKKKKQDEEAIKDKLDKIQELKNNTEDQVQAITESLAQTNAKDLAGQLADALVSAFQNGEDAAVAMGNVVNDVLRNAVVNSLKLKFLEKPLDEAVKYLSEAMSGGLSDTEKKVFGSMVTTAGNNFNNALAAYDEILGATDAARSGASKGIATADQDSIDELNGGVYALRSGVADIRNSSREQLLIQRTISSQLDRIADNTEHLKDIAKDINDIKVKGVNIKV